MTLKVLFISICCLILLACSDSAEQLNVNYGKPQTRDRLLPANHPLALQFSEHVLPVLEKRCVVCHGCYDAPCQLKLSSAEGIDRGFSPELVYGTRLHEIAPGRLFIDAKNTQEWRDKNFKPVLNERDQTPIANLQGSVLYQLLTQKNSHPLPDVDVLPESFDFSLNRQQQCPSIETLDKYQNDFPLAGMPYGLPGIEKSEFKIIENWVEQGAPMAQPKAISASIQERVEQWEGLLNGADNRAKLVSRYIYEHLFLGHIYFSEEAVEKGELPVYFRLVRSTTPTGQEINEIASRRPYDDPKVDTVYYRLRRETGTILTKTHLPYAFNQQRKLRWHELFYNNPFTVPTLPGYDPESNPFKVFAAIPADLRYQFMLDEAEFTIMGFIKGPVCRGQTALNVIQDKFWVLFSDPSYINQAGYEDFIYQQADDLQLPSVQSSKHFVTTSWLKFSKRQKSHINAQHEYLKTIDNPQRYMVLNGIWKGNENAALTVFRNFDSGVVKKGLQGEAPKTAWLITYPVLERIHYLLVAGFDIYGSVRHQLVTRLYMDFLRIEAEMAFIMLLPREQRKAEIQSWYIDSTEDLKAYLNDSSFYFNQKNNVRYKTDNPKKELFDKLNKRQNLSLNGKQLKKQQLAVTHGAMAGLSDLPNPAVQQLAQTSFILIEKEGEDQLFTLLRHNKRKNISMLLRETKTRQPELDTAELFKGLIGSYPQVIFRLKASEQAQFVKQLSLVYDPQSYARLLDSFAVRRSNPDFWQVSDKLHQLHFQDDPITYGLFDYNRLQNR